MHRFNDAGIDSDHDVIINRFDSMCGIVSSQDYDPAARRELIQSILHYTSEHFAREERHMRARGYPGLREHELAHAYMHNEFHRLLAAMAPERPNMAADARLLREMFLFHILTHDETYAEWLAGQLDAGGRRGGSLRLLRRGSRSRLAGARESSPAGGPPKEL